MTKNNHYYIRSVEDFLSVPKDKREDCLHDFLKWMEFSDALEGVTPYAKLDNQVFHWVDDGIRGVSGINVTIKRADDDD